MTSRQSPAGGRAAARKKAAKQSRRLSVVLAADVAGYSRLMSADEAATLRALNEHRAVIDKIFAARGGRLANSAGDSVVVEFASVGDAVGAAVDVQRRIARRNADRSIDQRMEFRMGIHLGDIIEQDGDLFGGGINVAARLQSMAFPGGVCVSAAVHDSLSDKTGIAFDDLGPQELRNIAQPVHVYRVRLGRAGDEAAPRPTAARGADGPSIAVLPFKDFDASGANAYFVDGVVEDVTAALARFKWLHVTARNSAFVYKNRVVDIRQIARELDVRYVLEGGVRRDDKRVRITAELIDARNAANLWTGTIDGALDDIFALQDRVAAEVVTAVEPKLRDAEMARARRVPTTNLTAYDHYLRAMALRGPMTREASRRALEHLDRAIALDPDYALAHAAAAVWCMAQRDQGLEPPSAALTQRGVAHARAAVESDPHDPAVLGLAGHTLASLGRDVGGGLAMIERSLKFNPNSADAWARFGMVRVYADELDPAVAAAEQALRLSPFGPDSFIPMSAIAYARLFSDRFEDARDFATRLLAGPQRSTTAFRVLAVALAHLGRIDEAREVGAQLLAADPDLRLATWHQRTPFIHQRHLWTLDKGLRIAGIPE